MTRAKRASGPKGTRQRPRGPFEQALTEAIDAVAAPQVRDRVLSLALAWGHHAVVPEHSDEVAYFVAGPLMRALEHVLGPATAAAVSDELAPVVAGLARRAVSSVRPRGPGPEDDTPELEIEEPAPRRRGPGTDPAPKSLPTVLIASSDPGSVSALGLALSGAVYIEVVSDAVSMLEALGRGEASLVVLDCRHPTLRAETLLTMQPELPQGGKVVFWGEQPALERQLDELGAGLPESFVFCGRDATADDIAAVCRILIE
jgi:hypothetical protein